MKRSERAAIAAETDAIVREGAYVAGGTVRIGQMVAAATDATHLHEPDEPVVAADEATSTEEGSVEVTGETTLEAVRRLELRYGGDVACLNFASANYPGGGYRGGSEAQEESLARSSALVACLETAQGFYARHRAARDEAYSDTVVCSPGVPVFRDDNGNLLAAPYQVAVITCAAPNARALRERGAQVDLGWIFRRRGARVLEVAASHRWRYLVLGAWGCGVFGNDPAVVAGTFAELLGGRFATAFTSVTFAVLDRVPGTPTRRAFDSALRSSGRS